jgi:hypothetical protein
MTFDIPTTAQLGAGQTARPPQYLIARDPRWDLALVRVDAGPFPYVCPVVGAGYNPVGRRIVSVGYDEMRLPVTVRTATVTRLSGGQVFTREPPWHGRSGGSLIDVDLGCLVGVCSGYAGNPGMAARESPLGGPGIYVSHTAVRSFLSHYGWR